MGLYKSRADATVSSVDYLYRGSASPYAGMPHGALGATHPDGAAVAVALTVA